MLLFEYWIVEFLIYEAVGGLFEIKKRLREHMNYEIGRVLIICLRTSKKLSGETFDNC